ncbi:MAG: hypothetical protein IJO49_04110 [Clostridia bacterium]|nr:hypothetical protein [Clostridia bacterium]
MGEFVKWGLLVAGALLLIGLVIALPFTEFLNVGELGNQLEVVVDSLGSYLAQGRMLLNYFLTPFGATVLSGILGYIMFKWIIQIGIKTTAWVYHFIFK